jgi:hypothetical protein
MAHYAFLDQNNIVTEVIVGTNENEEGINWEEHYGNFRGQVCKRTSYNTFEGVHKLGGMPFRKNFAGIGFIYDSQRDAFIPPKPFNSWILNEDTCVWKAPVDYPITNTQNLTDEFGSSINDLYIWDEETQSWALQNI